MINMWKIGNVEIKNQVVMAPMAGITNIAFRKLIKSFGAGLVVSEMISDKAICYRNEKTLDMLAIDEDEHPMSLQLFGGEVASMVEAAKYLEEHTNADIIDLNSGCPVNKVIKAKAGSDWLRDPERAYEIVHAIVEAVSLPVTIKMRIGFDSKHINVVEYAKLMEKAGVSAIAVHGRTRSQFYEGHADWSYIKQVKDAVSIPIIGNGDITSPLDAKRMLKETGCDAIMIGRAAMGNPWIIKRTVDYLEKGVLDEEPTFNQKIDMCLTHAKELCKLEGEVNGIRMMRGQAPWYIKGEHGAAKVKNQLTKINTYEELEAILKSFQKEIEAYNNNR